MFGSTPRHDRSISRTQHDASLFESCLSIQNDGQFTIIFLNDRYFGTMFLPNARPISSSCFIMPVIGIYFIQCLSSIGRCCASNLDEDFFQR
jgi:hypothetical protein